MARPPEEPICANLPSQGAEPGAAAATSTTEGGGRRAAGADPAKRAQILDGARTVFSTMGYDAASVADIAAAAGVSKGTIYVYFGGKEDLFATIAGQAREAMFQRLAVELDRPGPLEERLERYAILVARTMCSEPVIKAHRVLIGVADRMPELARQFYERGAEGGGRLIVGILKPEIEAGRLIVPDLPLAAMQMFELSLVSLFRRRLFGHMAAAPSEAEIARVASAAVKMFLSFYAAPAKS